MTEVAALIWTGRFDASRPDAVRTIRDRTANKVWPFVARAQCVLIAAASRDPTAFDPRPQTVCAVGWRILDLLLAIAAPGAPRTTTVDQALARAWRVTHDAESSASALILCADHELNVSSFTARAVASAGSTPYAAVIAGPRRHRRAQAWRGDRARRSHAGIDAADARCPGRRRRTATPRRTPRGFWPPAVSERRSESGRPLALVERVPPALDRRTFRATRGANNRLCNPGGAQSRLRISGARTNASPAGGAPLVLFAIGRTLGWIAHALERYRHEPAHSPSRPVCRRRRVCAHVKSNTVIFTDSRRTLAIGAGQMSRVDAVNVALMKAQAADRSLAGSVAASDAFFPFRDGLDAVARAGATAVIHPGGSVRDAEVIAAADEHGMAMVVTGKTALPTLGARYSRFLRQRHGIAQKSRF